VIPANIKHDQLLLPMVLPSVGEGFEMLKPTDTQELGEDAASLPEVCEP